MAERRAQQKWLPPDFDPKLHGSINGYHGSHHLRERAKDLHLGILIIRFEMPFDVWCLHCDKHIAMGVRYNAAKKKIGMYYTTPIYEFKMKCHLCSGELVVHTDPKNTEYVCVRGLRRKVKEWEPSPEETGQARMVTDEERKKLDEDAFYKVEHVRQDEDHMKSAVPAVAQLQDWTDRAWSDPYARSQQLRKQFRKEKKRIYADAQDTKAIEDRFGLDVPILARSQDDAEKAQSVEFAASAVAERDLERKRLILASGHFLSTGDAMSKPSALFAKEVRKRKLEQALVASSIDKKHIGIVKRRLPNGDPSQPLPDVLEGDKPENAWKSIVDYDSSSE